MSVNVYLGKYFIKNTPRVFAWAFLRIVARYNNTYGLL